MNKIKIKYIFFVVIALISIVLFMLFNQREFNKKNIKNTVIKAQQTDLSFKIQAVGTIQPNKHVKVGSQISGQINHIFPEVGDVVKKDELIVSIDNTLYKSRVNAAKSYLFKLQAQLNEENLNYKHSEIKLTRIKKLKKQGAISLDSFDETYYNLLKIKEKKAALVHEINQYKHVLHSEEVNLGYTNIFSPMDGIVTAIYVNEGQTLNINQQAPILMEIADLSKMLVYIKVSEADINKVSIGQNVTFRIYSDSSIFDNGVIEKIALNPEIINNSVYYTVITSVDNKLGLLSPGMSADVDIIVYKKEKATVIPSDALLGIKSEKYLSDRKTYFFRQMLNDSYVVKKLIIGYDNGINAEVLEGLLPGEEITVMSKGE
ncbi:efflux RND transporter periplasmic adaptor subunit [Salmonella enterica]|nr:efflux RND transporter periplasmic adaptor subunit [Salmonella enterica]EFO5648733.1 efflux RND transporter periplasmic adaptor subunit [Salmonella enterica subsp. enterica serovar Miami]EAT1014598.1 efflux RND transporter periplasmic adaptor subunit [Salmonella enterica]EBB2055428.1 efflux RND transporter periplasmic adaptor subunit [Salmonella enterica]EBN0646556.1 efflux RND transporter periplasmic adaptor subunit [Salmonella enterica]